MMYLLVACSKKSSNDEDNNFTPIATASTAEEINELLDQFAGSWKSSCKIYDIGYYFIWRVDYTSDTLTSTGNIYDNTSCSGESVAQVITTSTIKVGDNFTDGNGLLVFQVDEFTNERDTSGDPNNIIQIRNAVDTTFYTIIHIDSTTGTMYFGDYKSGDGLLEANRPTSVNLNVPYTLIETVSES